VRKNEIIEGLVKFYGEEARDYIDFVEKNWNLEPFNGGCPNINLSSSGLMQDFARATREPYFNVHFSGTESATEWQGYMDGAVESGERCANEVLYRLFDLNNKIKVDYTKTYYYQKEQSAKIMEKNNNVSASKSWTSQLFKISFAVGLTCLVLSNKNIIDYSLNKLFKF